MKGFAILCVVFGHVILFCLKCQQDNFVYHVVTSFHMPLFALMSGLMFKPVLGWAKATSKLASQSLKLLLPFATVGLLYTYLVLGYGGGEFILNGAKMGYWYLFFLWQCYLITHIYNNIGSGRFRKKGWARYSIDILWMLLMMIIPRIVGRCSEQAASLLGVYWLYNYYFFFFLGHIIQREGYLTQVFLWNGKRFDAALIGYVAFFALALSSLFVRAKALIDMAAAFFGVYVIISLFVRYSPYADRCKHGLETLGRYSLDVYVLHYFLIQSCKMEWISGNVSLIADNQFVLTIIALFLTALIATASMAASWFFRQSSLLAFLLLGNKK